MRVEAPTTPASVLIVDDELGPRESIRLTLEPHFRVTAAESGEQALEMLRHQRVDVVTLDLTMPGLSGIATFRKMREIDSDVEIVVISAEGSSGEGLDTLRHGVLAWIAKPFDAAQLVQTVERAAERHRIRLLRVRPTPDVTVPEAHVDELEAAQMFSHDVKNRLNVVLGFAHLLRENHLDRAQSASALDAIGGSAREVMTLAVNFLHAVESDGGPLQLHRTPASMNQIVEQVIRNETPRARFRRIELRADLDPDLPSVSLDVVMTSHALTTLLENAVGRSPAGGIVRIETRRFDDALILRVHDSGPGIPVDEIADLLRRDPRRATSASCSSTTLGLHFVREIVEAHDGSVSVTLPQDGGSAFVIALPLSSR